MKEYRDFTIGRGRKECTCFNFNISKEIEGKCNFINFHMWTPIRNREAKKTTHGSRLTGNKHIAKIQSFKVDKIMSQTFAVLNATFLQSGKMLTDHGGK